MSVGAAATGMAAPFARATAVTFKRSQRGTANEPTRLNSNENAYGPSKKALEAMSSACPTASRYPFTEDETLTRRIASFHNVDPERVLLGCGSTEILRVAAVAFLGRGRKLIQASPTFEAIEQYARSVAARVVSLPLDRKFAHDLKRMSAEVDLVTGLVYICNPNNPTASITPRKDLEVFLRRLPSHTYVVIDEAYHDYADRSSMYASFIDHPVQNDRVIVCRTFSTVYGLAGLRLGYCVAASALIERMRSHITSDSINTIAARGAMAALQDRQSVAEFVRRNTDDRQEFFNRAMARRLKPIESHANFVMMDTYRPAKQVIAHFRQRNILIGRLFPAMETHARISLGTQEEMQAFWEAWDSLPFTRNQMHH